MKRWIGRLACWLLLGIFLNPGVSLLWAARTDRHEKDITQKKKDLKDIKKEITVTREKEKEIRGQESSILESLSQIETKLYQKEKELQQMDRKKAASDEMAIQSSKMAALVATLNFSWPFMLALSSTSRLKATARLPPVTGRWNRR